ncbi:MAG: DNA repair protein RecO [Prevotella sp.]|nr:DNA repair protein RecO [Prevotella sp.]
MFQKVQGIVLSCVDYNDRYLFVQIYTDSLGRATYLLPRVTGKTSKLKKALFSPLSVLDMDVEHRPARDIQRIREAHPAFPLYAISCNLSKASMAFFLSEFLSKILRDVNENNNLFRYLLHSVEILEYTEKSIANYHLVFMMGLARYLGFYPNLENCRPGVWFDMLNGMYVDRKPLHNHYISGDESIALSKLHRISYENMHLFRFSRRDRNNIVNRILEYYRIHLHDFPAIKSLDVLHELF